MINLKNLFIPEKKIYGGHPYFFCREGEYKTAILMESTVGDPRGDIAVYPYTLLTWYPPHDRELIPAERRSEIMSLLDKYIPTKMRATYYVVDDLAYEQKRLEEFGRGKKIYWLK